MESAGDCRVHELPETVVGWCPHCNYDLRATLTLSGTTCTECGARLPFDSLTHVARGAVGRWVATTALPLAVPLLAAWRGSSTIERWLVLPGLIVLAVFASPAELLMVTGMLAATTLALQRSCKRRRS